jgi:hypothetical protein
VPVAGLAYLPQAWAYVTLNGRIGPSRLVSRKMSWHSPHAIEVLASPRHGFLLWTPIAIIGVAGLLRLALGKPRERWHPDARWIGVVCLVMMVLQVYVAGSVESWTVAGAFGQRRFVALTVLLALGVATLADVALQPVKRIALYAALGLCIWWNIGLMAQFGAGMMNRQRLELGRNAYVNFVVLPTQLPGLAVRYLFDRESFYRPPDR